MGGGGVRCEGPVIEGGLPPGSHPRQEWIIYLLQVHRLCLHAARRLPENTESRPCPCSELISLLGKSRGATKQLKRNTKQ